jgi:Protein of unknown function (DUF3043)
VPSLFRRKSTEDAEPAITTEDVVEEPVAPRRGHTPSKKELGKVTPKRGARRVVEPPPANRREAARRLRERQRRSRLDAREGMRQGREEYLLPRDKGADRALVRDIVDARRNVATYVLFSFFILIFTTSPAVPAVIRVVGNLLFYLLLLGVVLDSMLLTRKVKAVLTERFPKEPIRKGTSWYAIMRSLSIRRLRIPAPRVKIGQKV